MKLHVYLLFGLICSAALGSCSASHDEGQNIPSPAITKAKFVLGKPSTVVITGEFFKMKSDSKSDVIVSLNGAEHWLPAKSIENSSPTSYTAVIPYGVEYPQVWVRVYGLSEHEYSPPFLVQGQE